MEMKTAAPAMATVDGRDCDLLDAQGRLVVTPHVFTIEGQANVPADLRPGESLHAFLQRHVPGIDSGAWGVSISGHVVPRHMWARTYPRHGQLIACRAVAGKSVLALVAIAVLSYFTLGMGGMAAGSFMGMTGVAGYAAAIGVFVAGSILINKVLGPKMPKLGDGAAARQVYSLKGQRNTARAYEPLPVLLGVMRVTPDLASQPYTWFEGDDQYLSTILLGGINVHSAQDLAIGETPIGNYADVQLYFNGFPGMPDQDMPLYSHASMVPGAEFENDGPWITRTGAAGAVVLQIDIEGQLYDMNEGDILPNDVDLIMQCRLVGAPDWTALDTVTLKNSSMDALRRTLTFSVAAGQYEVRARLGKPRYNEGGTEDRCLITWTSLKSIQPDSTDYRQWGRTGIRIKASGQISGGLDTVRAIYIAKPMPVWTGADWAMATTRAEGLSNPGAQILLILRGIRDPDGALQYGFGLDDEQIDIEGLKSFMLHCAANGYAYDRWITSGMSLGQVCEEIALAGMGQFAWVDGSRPTVHFVSSSQPLGGVVNMANMLKASFSVDYTLSNAADGIEYQYLDRDTWETRTLRVTAPGVTTMLSPARVTGEGVTSEAHAAVLARYHLAQSLYQYKTIGYSADIEHLDYRRLSVLSISHDLTQWGFGGRLVAAEVVAGRVVVMLDEPVPPLPTPHVGLRLPGERDYRVFQVVPLTATYDRLTLLGDWPEGVALPGQGLDNPAHDTLWCYDFKATPGYRVRVVSMEPEADLKGARIACVPEGPEFWDYVLNGNYVPAPNQSSIPQLDRPAVSNLRVTESVHLQGDTEWYELSCLWDVSGAFDHAQVWAGRDGAEPRLVDGNAQARSTFRINGAGQWLIQVRPFDMNGRSGQMAGLLYITTQVGLAPWNPQQFVVQVMAGGLRRYAWQWTSDRPATLAGVQIRCRPGNTPATVADWDAMQPLGAADDVYTAQFESTRPDAGTWTFALRAVNTAGQLAAAVKSFSLALPEWLGDIQAPDLTPPPAPTDVAVIALMTTALVSWAAPVYPQGQGHAHSVIYLAAMADGQPPPAFADAVSVLTTEAVPASIPVELGMTYRLWVVHVSKDGGMSAPSAPAQFETLRMDSDLIDNVNALVGRFGSVFADRVQATAISASQLTVGDGVIGGTLKSINYAASPFGGWMLRPDGKAEFADVVMSGTVYATAGQIGGLTINYGGLSGSGFTLSAAGLAGTGYSVGAGGINGGAFTGYAWPGGNGTGFHLGPSGLLLGNPSNGKYFQVTAEGNIYAHKFSIVDGNATFGGNLFGAGGTFGGLLTADAINAVDTINLAGQAVTIPISAYSEIAPGWGNGVTGYGTYLSVSLPPSEAGYFIQFGAVTNEFMRLMLDGAQIDFVERVGDGSSDYPVSRARAIAQSGAWRTLEIWSRSPASSVRVNKVYVLATSSKR